MILIYENCPNCFAPMNFKETHTCKACGFNIDNLKINENIIPPFRVLKNNYLLGRSLGQGGFGVTYTALDMKNNRLCAIKEYLPGECVYRDEKMCLQPLSQDHRRVFEHGKEKFLEEARILYQFSDNPVVVTIYDYFSQNNTAYLVMELLDGVNLKILSKSCGGRIPLDLAVRMLTTVTKALSDIHKKGILHRDISPENIFITKNEDIRLIDFGAARNYITTQNTGMSVLLKPGYAPPEQYSSQGSYGPWTDIYALAASFYTLVSGQKLIDSMLIMRGERQPSLYELNCGVSLEFSKAIEKAMALNYRERYQNCSDFLTDIMKSQKEIISDNDSNKKNNSSKRYVAYLRTFNKRSNGQETMEVPANRTINIGRSQKQSDFTVSADSKISRVHCSIIYDEKNRQFKLIDKSANGTFINGVRLNKGMVYILNSGDCFYLVNANTKIEVKIELVE